MKTLIVLAALAAFFMSAASAGEAQEKIMRTDEGGYLVLTLEPCAVISESGYEWKAYALQVGQHEIEGCWQRITEAVNLMFPDDPFIYTFANKVFADKEP